MKKFQYLAAKEFVRTRLFDQRRYDLEEVGRYKYKQKLDVVSRLKTIAQGIHSSQPTIYFTNTQRMLVRPNHEESLS